ncbi:hypothetical protein BJ170DRAFT_624129 [Xylariales sp. AK1849]|nr:hypothetical protein BJ170DRAFT_624129 [Xylariales sp. AK1849]
MTGNIIKTPVWWGVPEQHPVEANLIRAAATWANDVHFSLAGIKHNTSQIFFWTIIACTAVIGILLLYQLQVMVRTLNNLYYQLCDLNDHQANFKELWSREQREMKAQIESYERERQERVRAVMESRTQVGLGTGRERERRRQHQTPAARAAMVDRVASMVNQRLDPDWPPRPTTQRQAPNVGEFEPEYGSEEDQ